MVPRSDSRILYLLSAALYFAFLFSIPAFADDPAPFTVSCLLPLSGRPAEYGVAAKNGIELALKDRPELFKHIRFLFDDSLYSGKTTITAFQKAVNFDNADLTFVWGHGPAEALAPVAESARRAAVLITGQRDVAAGKSYSVRFCSPHVAFASALLKEVSNRGYKNIAVAETNLGFLADTTEAFADGIRTPQSVKEVASFEPGETDFQATVAKLSATRTYDLLGLFLAEDQLPLFLSRMAAMKLNPPLFGTHSLGGEKTISALRQNGATAFFSSNFVDASFHERYLRTFGADIQVTWAANAYDFAILTGELFGALKKRPNAEQIIEAYRSVSGKVGVTGRYSFLDDATYGTGFVFPVVIKTITRDGINESPPGG